MTDGDTDIEVVGTGMGLVESPRWHGGRLWFSDWIAGRIIAVADDGDTEVILEHESMPLCFDFLPGGRLVVVSNQRNALVTVGEDGDLVTYADLSPLSSFGCNDIVVDGRGNAYVNSPNFEFSAGPPPGEIQPGFVAVITPDGIPQIAADDLAFPNGMAVTPDASQLIVADSYRHALVAFDIQHDGGLASRRVWADLGEDAPDGICLDAEGAAWYADVPHRRCVRVREGGERLCTVNLDRGAFACMLGGVDRPSLYVTAAHWPGASGIDRQQGWDGRVLRMGVTVPGAGWPAR
jgi:sugar lactone lactonase YvrE